MTTPAAEPPAATTTTPAASSSTPFLYLPDVLLHQIIAFAAGPTYRASVVCHQLALLNHEANRLFLNEDSVIWDAIQTNDYGVQKHHSGAKRRASKRLKQTHLQRVRDAHLMVRNNTEIAYYYMSETCVGTGKNKLSKSKLCSILGEYGPHLRINSRMSTGGTFLVEACRARHVRESIILRCVEELVERHDAQLNVTTFEPQSYGLTALCVAAARGMPTVVKYLLRAGASPSIRSTGRFRLYTNARKTVKCTSATPLEFAVRIRDAEIAEGVDENDLDGAEVGGGADDAADVAGAFGTNENNALHRD